jgi:hypothetical protein
MIERYNKKTKIQRYLVNDRVMMLDRRNDQEKDTTLVTRWLGPYHIQEIVGQDVHFAAFSFSC